MADKFMQTVLTPAVLEAEKHYYGRIYPSFADSPETDAREHPELFEEVALLADMGQGRASLH